MKGFPSVTNKQPFCPPKTNALIVGLFKFFLPVLQRKMLKGLKVEIAEGDLQRLRVLKGESMLLMPNHPTADDPFVPFALSKQLGETFNFVAARELFNLNNGFRGWLLQRCGVYSVIRGACDRESFKTTKDILVQGQNRLVIFIEGEVSNENDTLIPFEPGVIQLAFWALEEKMKLWKQGNPTDTPPPNLYLAPMAIKYMYQVNVDHYIEKALQDLETAVILGYEPKQVKDMDFIQRILNIGHIVLASQEKRLSIVPEEGSTLNERLEVFKDRLLQKMEHFLDLKPSPSTSVLDRIRGVRNRLDKASYTFQEPPPMSPYEARMLEHLRLELQEFYDELERTVNLLVLREGSIADNKTPERYIDVIRRLEREVYGQPATNPPRTAIVKVAEIANLKDHYEAYEQNKKQTVQALADQFESSMYQLLQSIGKNEPALISF